MTLLSAHGGRAALVPRIMPRRAETALKRPVPGTAARIRAAEAKTVLATVSQVAPSLASLRALIDSGARGHRVAIHIGETNRQVSGSALTSSITNALYLGETVPTLLENGSEAVAWWALR